jgi:hypothetical protein
MSTKTPSHYTLKVADYKCGTNFDSRYLEALCLDLYAVVKAVFITNT